MVRVLITVTAAILAGCSADGKDANNDGNTDGNTGPDVTWPVGPCVDDTFEPLVVDWEFDLVDEGNDIFHMSYVPEGAQGLVMVFHGSGGGVSNTNGLHYERLYKLFTDVGMGILVSDSMNRQQKEWDRGTREPGQNEDMLHMKDLRDDLIAQGKITHDTPIYAWGFSNGGGFTNDFVDMAQQLDWPIRGAIVHNANWSYEVDIPTFFTTAENDEKTQGASRSAEDQAAAGYESSFTMTYEHAFQADEMMIHPGYDATFSQDVYDELVTMALIDANGERLADLDRLEVVLNNYIDNTALGGSSRVEVQLRVAWATHRPSSETGCEERDFILSHL